MGFFDVVKNIGTSVAQSFEERAAEIRAAEAKLGEYDDERLLRIVKNDGGFFGHSTSERAVAAKLLKQRGYSPEDFRNS